MYECPTTHPMSDVQNIVSPGARSKMRRIELASATRYPPVSRCTPLGLPVVPDV
jgi:hypothetical protein